MSEQLVTLDDLMTVVEHNFNAAELTWNSANFVTIVASDDPDKIDLYKEGLIKPAIEEEFSQYFPLPYKVSGAGTCKDFKNPDYTIDNIPPIVKDNLLAAQRYLGEVCVER